MPRVVIAVLSLVMTVWLAGCRRNADSASSPGGTARGGGQEPSEEFLRLMNTGKSYLEQGDATNAIAAYLQAAAILPSDVDVHLNLANAYLQAGVAAEAVREADEVLKLDRNSAAGWFVKGSAWLRLSNFEEAVKAFENARKIEPGVAATSFQLGVARMGLHQWEEAILAFREGINMEPNRLHTSARYLLGQSLMRAGRTAEAERELSQHQAGMEGGGRAGNFERSKYTLPRVPFMLDQPAKEGIQVKFVDATGELFGNSNQKYSGPVGIIDPNRTGWNSLFVVEKEAGYRVLWNRNGKFQPDEQLLPADSSSARRVLAGDLQNDRFDDVIVLGEAGTHVFQFATNGHVTNVTASSRLGDLRAVDGTLMDLDFAGKLDLIAVTADHQVRVLRQFGPLAFADVTATSGIPAELRNAQCVVMEEWSRDENMDLIVSRTGAAPLLLEKERGGPLRPREQTSWSAGAIFCTGDFDNDLRADIVVVSGERALITFNAGNQREIALAGEREVRRVVAIDYDNDGWLDLWVLGSGIRAWRNLGAAGFQEQSTGLGLDKLDFGATDIHFADFDNDCDSDAVVELVGGELRYLRNDGGNANRQVKVQLVGNRSNASGLGCKVEITTGRLRLMRTVQRLPIEIGVGRYETLDSFLVHWFNWPQGLTEAPVDCKIPLLALELTIQEGSCPYLYAWDGTRFRFVTDILGAAPLGLPVAEGRYIESDPEEFVCIGDEQNFQPKQGYYEVRITEELREVLYLDEAKLVVLDREPDTEVHPTDKLLPGRPFPPGTLMELQRERRLQRAEAEGGRDVTAALRQVDGQRVSPPRLRTAQLRGLAEPHSLVLDFGALDTSKPLALVMNGWLRFGGGMANIAASHDPGLPFPFPRLEAEVAGGWKAVDVVVGAPAGKTKTIVVDLEGKLPEGTRRLRLSQAFEIHWDRIALMERTGTAPTWMIEPTEAELRYRGFSEIEQLPEDWPLTPNYDRVSPNYFWTLTPGGWCTRYGDVRELIARRDEGLVLINSGDELRLRFSIDSLPPKKPGLVREFFLYVDGWDKDSDFHVARGTEVEPLPFHGMDDQMYGKQKRPSFPSDELHRKYNTRWVESRVLRQAARRGM